MLNLHPEEQRIFEQLAKGRAAHEPPTDSPTSSPAPSCDSQAGAATEHLARGHAKPKRKATDLPVGDAALANLAQATDLMALLGYDNLTGNADRIKFFYLIGRAYDLNARSGRKILKLLASPPPALLADGLAVQVRETLTVTQRNLFKAIFELENLLHIPLVNRLGGGLPFDGLTEGGKLFWRLVADYLQKYLLPVSSCLPGRLPHA